MPAKPQFRPLIDAGYAGHRSGKSGALKEGCGELLQYVFRKQRKRKGCTGHPFLDKP